MQTTLEPKQLKRKATPPLLKQSKIDGYVPGIEGISAGISSWQGTGNLAPANAKYCISTDWLQFILEASSELVNYGVPLDRYDYSLGKIHLERLQYGTKIFQFGYSVWLHGRRLGTMFCAPKKVSVLKPTNMQFEVMNNIQYEVGWLDDIKFLFKEMQWEVRNVTRLDIALDGKGFFGAWNKYETKKIMRKGYGKEKVHRVAGAGKRIVTGFDIGSGFSNKRITCYNKTDEIKKSNKKYIYDYWQRSGLDTKRVERMELKLKNEALKMLDGFFVNGKCEGWKRLDDFEYLASIFRTFVDGGNLVNRDTGEVKEGRGLLVFVIPDKQKNICRKVKVDFINWKNIGAVKLDKLSAKETTELWSMKLTAKRLVLLSESCRNFKSQLNHPQDRRNEEEKYKQRAKQFRNEAHEIASNINCLGWLSDNVEEWIASYSKRKLNYIPNFRIENANGEMQYMYEFEADLHLPVKSNV